MRTFTKLIKPLKKLKGADQLPKPYVEFMLMILEFFKLGYSERITDSVEKITGRKPIKFTTYAQDYKTAFV